MHQCHSFAVGGGQRQRLPKSGNQGAFWVLALLDAVSRRGAFLSAEVKVRKRETHYISSYVITSL